MTVGMLVVVPTSCGVITQDFDHDRGAATDQEAANRLVLPAADLPWRWSGRALGRAVDGQPVPTSREDRWKADLEHFARELPARHKDFSKLISREEFERELAKTNEDLLRLSEAGIILRLMRQVASLGIVHTRVGWPSGDMAFHRYPILFDWFSDDLVVIAASSECREAIGCPVRQIGSHTPEEVEELVSAYIPNENDAGLHNESPDFIRVAELLQHLGIADDDGHLRVSLQTRDGQPMEIRIPPIPAQTQTRLIHIWDALSIPGGLSRKRLDAFYWYDYSAEQRTLYVQYRACRNMPGNPFDSFVGDLLAFASTHPVERMVVDLRQNGGGSSSVVKPLLNGLKSHPALTGRGSLYVLIGRRTVSSGMFAALDFANAFNAILVGEPTGARPNAYGDMRSFRLPNSQLEVRYSTKYFQLIKNAEPPSLEPDFAVSCSSADFLAGRDPALEFALRHQLR